MKNKGTVITFTAILALVCIYQLSFSLVTRNVEKKAKLAATVDGKVDATKYKRYLDSVSRETVYSIGVTSYTYQECKQRELSLGLDLRGGMNVLLEISTEDVIKGLAGPNAKNKELVSALEDARKSAAEKEGDFVDYFATSFKKIAPDKSLAPLFVNSENKGLVSHTSTDAEVIEFLKNETKSASERSFEVIETRIAQSNVSQPNIQRQEGGRISVELPGAENPDQIRRMLQESAQLEFWEVYGNTEKNGFYAYKLLDTANKVLAAKLGGVSKKITFDSTTNTIDTTGSNEESFEGLTDEEIAAKLAAKSASKDSTSSDTANSIEKFRKENPLFSYLMPAASDDGRISVNSFSGYTTKENMDKVMELLTDPILENIFPRNIKFAWGAQPLSPKSNVYALYMLKGNKAGQPALGGDIIVDARPNTGQTGQIEISMTMNEIGAKDWKFVTGRNIGEYIAVVLDGKVYSAPVVNQEIPSGMSVISGSFDLKEAQFLSNILKAGRLPAPARIVAEDIVGPTLGIESIRQGSFALIGGFLSVLAIMFLYYARGGVASTIAVLLNMFFVVGILSSFGAALTLPGIAGLVLTIGMAVDANVLIFERIKEELADGKAIKTAVSNGYKAALSSILDSNITTLLAGIIMTFAGAGPLYGFAIILIIGILSSLYTAILITRIIIEGRVNKNQSFTFGFSYSKIGQNANFDFIKNRKKYYILSSVIIIAGMVAMFGGGLTSGIDFKGGWSYRVQLDKNIPSFELKKALDASLKGSSNEVKTIGSDNRYKIVTSHLINSTDEEAGQMVEADLIKSLSGFGLTKDNILSSTKVGPTVASSIRAKSTVIIIVAIVVMFVYLVIRFKKLSYGLGATVALIHDVLMVFSVFALLGKFLPFSTEIDQTFIAAMLTIVGYSINDSVVVFDRVREFLSEKRISSNIGQTINNAINSTLSRTLLTSSTTLFVVLILFLFGGEALKSFSFALLVGIGVGTYSSIFIATPIVLDFMKKDKEVKA
jgi:SecD/SecF fusion protein